MRPLPLAVLVACLPPLAAQQAAAPPAEPPAQPEQSRQPRVRRQSGYVYDGTGRRVAGEVGVREERRDGTVERQETIRGADGRPVTVRATQERVLSEQGGVRVAERVIQRYDPEGRPASKQIVKIETRRNPDGSTVSVETLYEQDLNGRLQLTERRTTTESKAPGGGAGSVVVERPSFQGSLQVVERTDRVETQRGPSVTESNSTVRRLDPNGQLVEFRRESTVTTVAGNRTTRESRQWEFQPTGKLELVGRTVSNILARPDGNEVEDTEVYSTRIAGTTPDLNQPGVPTLEQKVRREKKVQPDGRIVETTSAQIRTVAEPTRLGGLMITEQVTTPTAEGATVETSLRERDANGRLVLVQRSVEEQKK